MTREAEREYTEDEIADEFEINFGIRPETTAEREQRELAEMNIPAERTQAELDKAFGALRAAWREPAGPDRIGLMSMCAGALVAAAITEHAHNDAVLADEALKTAVETFERAILDAAF